MMRVTKDRILDLDNHSQTKFREISPELFYANDCSTVLWRVIHAHDFNIKPLLFLERAVNKSGDILFGMGSDSESLSHVHM